ncbi:hypothetical protein, partial [Bacteroides ovatus]|uniref:hypothetical protein n=1 Tax=Bacteroides ovatus TaxID=28116 RepID=UPI00216B4624
PTSTWKRSRLLPTVSWIVVLYPNRSLPTRTGMWHRPTLPKRPFVTSMRMCWDLKGGLSELKMISSNSVGTAFFQ